MHGQCVGLRLYSFRLFSLTWSCLNIDQQVSCDFRSSCSFSSEMLARVLHCFALGVHLVFEYMGLFFGASNKESES